MGRLFHAGGWAFMVLGLTVALSVGCGGSTGRTVAPVESNLKILAIFYGRYVQQHRGQTPPDAEALSKFIKSHPAAELEGLKVTDVEQLFVSPRDKRPYVVRYGFTLPPPSPSGSPVVAYEQDGVGGQRFVAYANAGAEQVDAARFRQLVPAP